MNKRLYEAYKHAEIHTLNRNSRIVCMSDCHRGTGNTGDNFMPNKTLYIAAMHYYFSRGFEYFELGDGDELWENNRISRIMDAHKEVFCILSDFYCCGRLHMLYGNHDSKKARCYSELFPKLKINEAVVLKDSGSHIEILLIHGHQGDFMNDYMLGLTQNLVHNIWRPLELLGFSDPTSAARNYKKRVKTEKRLTEFASENNIFVIAGHTHRPVLGEPDNDMYANDGSCVHPNCITALEIENEALCLVKWCFDIRYERLLSVERKIIAGPYPIKDYQK